MTTTAPTFVCVQPGYYETPDGRFTMYRLEGVHPPAWNVEEVTFDAITDTQPGDGYDGLVVDGARTMADAKALFRTWIERVR